MPRSELEVGRHALGKAVGRNSCVADPVSLAQRQLRRLFSVPQCLVTARRMGVVIGMPLKVEEDDVGDYCVAVPTVARTDPLVASVGFTLAT